MTEFERVADPEAGPAGRAAIRCVLLDLDGTLTDPFVGVSRCIEHALETMGKHVPSRSELRRWIGPPLLTSFRSCLDAQGGGDAELALSLYRERFASTGLYENGVYPGIPGALERLRASGLRLIVATSKPEVYARRIIEHFELDELLDHLFGSELDGRRTDKNDLLAHVLAQTGIDAGQCLMVGDRKYDMSAARRHAIPGAGALWGYGTAGELREAGASVLLSDPAALVQWVSIN